PLPRKLLGRIHPPTTLRREEIQRRKTESASCLCAACVSRSRKQEAFWLLQTLRTNASMGESLHGGRHEQFSPGRAIVPSGMLARMQPARWRQTVYSER